MTEFASLVAEKWNIDRQLALQVCDHFDKGDSIFYLADYSPLISSQLDLGAVAAIYGFLQEISELLPKKKRIQGLFQKSDALSPEIENRIKLCTSSTELDDMVVKYRPNPRSRAQIAISRGLSPLADIIEAQEMTDKTPEEIAESYVGTNPSLNTCDDVLSGVKDILAERYAYDDTVRTMAREFGRENGFIEVTPKDRKDREFINYRGKMAPVAEITPEEYIRLIEAEEKKTIKIKFGVQLFRITELLRHHFILNPDSTAFDFICGAIDECWSRMLQEIVEADIKEMLRLRTQEWAMQRIIGETDSNPVEGGSCTTLAVSITDKKELVVVAYDADGHLLGAGREEKKGVEGQAALQRMRQFFSRYRPRRIFLLANSSMPDAEALAKRAADAHSEISFCNREAGTDSASLANSEWMNKECSYLDADMRVLYATGLLYSRPLPIITNIGVELFQIHHLQKYVSLDSLKSILNRKITASALSAGVSVSDIVDSPLKKLPCIPDGFLAKLKAQIVKEKYSSKNELLRVEGMTEVIFRNISGYLYFPSGASALDRSLIHPDHFPWVEDMASSLNVPVESLINDPEQVRSIGFDDFNEKIFIEKKLMSQLRFGQQFLAAAASRPRRRMHLDEIVENAVLLGRVTNITPFGVFIDVNAVCDGLIHISQLADGYVETPDQVVSLGDSVNVRVLRVDAKKRRISLSMKGLGDSGPRIKPTQNQLSSLADHFKNR
jgi:uncharacterized protein